ncbi:uncharacterized protein LOC141538107 isoform X2 [Cotesia typhae]
MDYGEERELFYTCGVCETICKEICSHPCMKPYKNFHVDKNYYFYPLLADKRTIIRRAQFEDGTQEVIRELLPELNGKDDVFQLYSGRAIGGGKKASVEEFVDYCVLDDEDDMLSLPLPQKSPTLQSASTKGCKGGKKKAIMSQKPQEESKLTDDEIEFLILEVQSRPPLWNYEIPLAKRSSKATDLLWEEISKAMNYRLSADDAKKRFKSLKDQYRKQVRAECRSIGSARIDEKKWRFYDACSFMRDCCLIKPTVGNVPRDDFHNSGVEGDDYISEDDAKNNNNSNNPISTTPVSKTSRKRTNNGLLDNNMSPLAMIAAKICKDSPPLTLPSTPKIDAVDNFLAGVGHEIRKLPEDKHLGVIIEIMALVQSKLQNENRYDF